MGRKAGNSRSSSRGDHDRRDETSPAHPEIQDGLTGLRDRRAVRAICVCLLLVVFVVYGQTVRYGFVNFDDNEYVYENGQVCKGLTREGIAWAFTDRVSSQWTPLTLLSLMADAQLLRPAPGPAGLARLAAGMHLVNILLHAANVLLLFLVLRAMTGRLWPCALAATVFAVHPLRVESVAWITERKDVLSGLFGLLSLASYVRYCRRPSVLRYLVVAILLALGLMAKPMLVTWPLVFLLVDFWPLRRPFSAALLAEKLPLLLLVAAFSVVAILGQASGDAVLSLEQVPLPHRIARAALLYVAYLGKTLWPANLAALYPDSPLQSYWPALGAGLLVVALTAGAFWAARRRQPWLTVGWLWYAITLVPVIGLLRVGSVVMADRFTYLPQIGLCVAFAWAAASWAGTSARRRWACADLSLLLVVALGACAWRQASYWRDSETLWKHSLACTSGTWIAHNNLGIALDQQRRFDEAVAQFRQSAAIRPHFAKSHYNLGNVLSDASRLEEAIASYQKAIAIEPNYIEAHRNLGITLERYGDLQGAIAEHDKALKIKPDYAEAHNSLGVILARHERLDEAIPHFQKALEIKPGFAEARKNLDAAWVKKAQGGWPMQPLP